MKRYIPFLLTVYVLITKGSQTIKNSYEGMSQQTVDSMLKLRTGITYQFVGKQAFDAVQDPAPTPPFVDPVKVQAVLDAKNTSKTADQRLNALITAIDLK